LLGLYSMKGIFKVTRYFTNDLLIDTHIWIWYATGDERLGVQEKQIFNEALRHKKILISSVSILELAKLVQRRRVTLQMSVRELIAHSKSQDGIAFVAIDADIALASCELPEPLHKDPADRLLIATALEYGARIMTHDKLMRSYLKKHFHGLLA